MEAALRLVPELPDEFTGEPTPENFRIVMNRLGELEGTVRDLRGELMKAKTRRAADDLEDELNGALETIKLQNRRIGTLERKVSEEADPLNHPKGKEIVALIERWMRATGHEKSKISDDRVKLVKARLRDGYTPEQIALAIDGLAANPFVVNAQRRPEGKPSQRYDQLDHCLKGGQKLEQFAVMGHKARTERLVTWGEES